MVNKTLAPEWLAFCQTKAFGTEKHSVNMLKGVWQLGLFDEVD
jgi:hypothetical protein